MSTILRSVRSMSGHVEGLSGYSCGDSLLHIATYRDVFVSVQRIDGPSLVLARKQLADINLVRHYRKIDMDISKLFSPKSLSHTFNIDDLSRSFQR